MSTMSCVTQYTLRRRCSSFGIRVANCVKGSSAVAIYAALFLDPCGRPGPRRRLRRRRPFFARAAVETLPSNDRIAERTSCCTKSRITVNKLLCLGIDPSLLAADTRTLMPRKGGTICWASSGESCWGGGHLHAFRQIGASKAGTCGSWECAVGAVRVRSRVARAWRIRLLCAIWCR